ncbi:nitrate reductase [Thalassovita mediterranea]|uniref:Nitrate reductase n=1 Tax=Thalassovita mediterranea TaxID=340021 RepID=A0A0P1GS56_9RHOB|nr:nitrate reductase [Thalassovita mediterranea]CUH85548.1 Nitrate reductase [Thalassovita mediterranea]SIS30201.1 assimilatory nitrate reductase (NADH) alpha subunit apoprotein [Thalassovita mediterranea]
MSKTIKTTCPYCGVGCGVLATLKDGQVSVKGDPDHPANKGRLCSKGSALAETLALDGRLLKPVVHSAETTWDNALDEVATRFKQTIAKHGPDSIALYVSGQLLTEDYYVANKLMKGFMGTANIDTNSRLCMASSVAGHKRAFGADTVPGNYEDLEQADLLVLVGSNLAWCHPVLYQRVAAAKAARPNMRIINIDPRHTATSDLADLHLAVAPGSDVALFNHLLCAIHEQGAVDSAYVAAHVNGFDAALEAASSGDVSVTGLPRADIDAFTRAWVGTEKVVTIYSQGVNQSTAGADKVNAILNCHLATGRIGRAGMGPFSVTGQPNAMGGREVGGLANMLACHMDLENAGHRATVREFWQAPQMPDAAGLKAVDMFRAVGDGRIKALWVMCTNPVVSLPEADRVKEAIEGCDFVVVSDMYGDTDTAKLADVLLPATGWGEKTGTVTNSERCISRQRSFLPAPGEARHDWDVLADVGRRMGWQAAFDYETPAEVLREYAALSGLAAGHGRDFDISALSDLSNEDYDDFTPQHWPISADRNGGRFFADGQFYTPSGKANMLPLHHRSPANAPTAAHPFVLNTGRIRDQWHTMSRSGLAPRLSQHMGEPYVEIHPRDAEDLGLKAADLAEVTSPHGRAVLRVLISDKMRRGEVFAPMHWTGTHASDGRIDALVAAEVDPVSGQPESKASPVKITKLQAAWYGYAVTHDKSVVDTDYWAIARVGNGWQAELAGMTAPEDWEDEARRLFDLAGADVQVVQDPARGLFRLAAHRGGQLIAALFIAPAPVELARSHLIGQLGGNDSGALAGRAGANQPDPGATICACFNVGVNTIIEAINLQNLISVEQIGAALNAGTNCGSCRPELAAILASAQHREAAE